MNHARSPTPREPAGSGLVHLSVDQRFDKGEVRLARRAGLARPPFAYGLGGDFGSFGRTELVEDVSDVDADGSCRDVQPLADLGVRAALADEHRNLLFALAEDGDRLCTGRAATKAS